MIGAPVHVEIMIAIMIGRLTGHFLLGGGERPRARGPEKLQSAFPGPQATQATPATIRDFCFFVNVAGVAMWGGGGRGEGEVGWDGIGPQWTRILEGYK